MDTSSFRYIYFGIWVVLAAANLYLFFGTKNARLKKTMLPILAALAGVMVLLWFVLAGFSRQSLYFALPVVVLLIFLNLRQFKICDDCTSLVRGEFFSAPKQCHKCGANLNAR